ncbi:MAG: TetR/AcrR family transcriptional regulator [Hamadaea sp.]|uniref:TetR/AcrR family transcriptional regulator n=1 Tax=Hamadaea sp. TaxID=2024425 RepID=UPI0017E9E658|nr:TetR/AcrR family transcriptional regulator [Hamadaea sp.]NUT22744.1 TetR/AcrR family transcriptional regulator [Hamadaea sp.]
MSTPSRADAVRNRQLALDAATALLAEPDTALTVEVIARKAGLGAGTVVRAFGGKDALLDAAVAGLLRPVVARGRELAASNEPVRALRTFLGELMAFQAAHHAAGDNLRGLAAPETTALRAELVTAVEIMIDAGRRAGQVRGDLPIDVLTTIIGESAYAVARSGSGPERIDVFLTVLLDGLRPST